MFGFSKNKDKLKKQLTNEEIKYASCLAKRLYLGDKPNWIDKLICKH